MTHTLFECLPFVCGLSWALHYCRQATFRACQFAGASIGLGVACALVAGELFASFSGVLGCIAYDSAAVASTSAGLLLVLKLLSSAGKIYGAKES
jgi:hypothetical protein